MFIFRFKAWGKWAELSYSYSFALFNIRINCLRQVLYKFIQNINDIFMKENAKLGKVQELHIL